MWKPRRSIGISIAVRAETKEKIFLLAPAGQPLGVEFSIGELTRER